jgi:hypothetical protein
MPPKKTSYGGKGKKRKKLQYEERAAMGTQGAVGRASAESIPAAARRHSATYREQRRQSVDSAASSASETEQPSRMSVTAATPNSRKRKSRGVEEVNAVLRAYSPESQASLLAAQHSKQSTAAGMQIYEENLNIAGLTSKIGEQFVMTFKSLQKTAQNLKTGTISERKTARKLKGHLLAAMVSLEADGDSSLHGDISTMLKVLGASHFEFTEAHKKRQVWLDAEKARKPRADSKQHCPAVISLVTKAWESKSQQSPVLKHQQRKEPGKRDSAKRKNGDRHDLHLVTFGSADVFIDIKEDAQLQKELIQIGEENGIKSLQKGQGLGLNIVHALRPWWCVTLKLDDVNNCIDRYETEFKMLYTVMKTIRTVQGHGTSKCKCKCVNCRPPSAVEHTTCQLQPFPERREFLEKIVCPAEEVTITGDIKGKFAPLECWRNVGGCQKCNNLKLMEEKFPRCLHNELNCNETRKFNGFRKVVKKVKMTKKKIAAVQAAQAAAGGQMVGKAKEDRRESAGSKVDPNNPILWICPEEEQEILELVPEEEEVEDVVPIAISLPPLPPEQLRLAVEAHSWVAEVRERRKELVALLARVKLERFVVALQAEGYRFVEDLADVADEELAALGLKAPEVKRLRKALDDFDDFMGMPECELPP